MARGSSPLTEKQRRLAEGYVEGMSLEDAARHAGYSVSNVNTAKVAACRTLKKPKVAAYVEVLRQKRKTRLEVTAQAFFEELLKIAGDVDLPGDVRVEASLGALDRMGFSPHLSSALAGIAPTESAEEKIARLPKAIADRMRRAFPQLTRKATGAASPNYGSNGNGHGGNGHASN